MPAPDVLVWQDNEIILSDEGWVDTNFGIDDSGNALFLDLSGKTALNFAEVSFANGNVQVVDFDARTHSPGSYKFLDFADGRHVKTVRILAKSTGFVTPGAGQKLRVTVHDTGRNATIRVRFAWMKYMAPDCIGMPAVCRHTIESQGATPLVTPNDDDALWFDVDGSGLGVNVVVESNSRDVQVNAFILDAVTGALVSLHPDIPLLQ